MSKLSLVALTLAATAAHADPGMLTPDTGNSSAPSNWRFTPGQLFNGVAALDGAARIDASGYRCSGSLLAGGQYVLTAGHCADDFSGTMTIGFQVSNGVAAVTRTATVASVTLHPLWQGFDNSADAGTDLALIKLNAPVTTINGYKLSSTNDVGKTMLIGGYGTTRAATSNNSPGWGDDSFGHYAYNVADVTSKDFNLTLNNYVDDWGATADYYTGTTYMFDFDEVGANSANSNSLSRIAGLTGNAWVSGLAVTGEGITAGGDSGGGDYVWNGSEWLLSGVHSWGWQGNENDGTGACDFVGLSDCSVLRRNDSSYGDLSGSTAVFDQTEWIYSVIGSPVPEPQTYALMLLGLGGLVAVKRRRRAG